MKKIKTMMKRKIKIFLVVALILFILISATLIILSNTKISYYINISKPDNIVVYSSSYSNNIVYEKDSKEYIEIYNAIKRCHKQTTLTALCKHNLSKTPQILETETSTVDFNQLLISFAYNTPQPLKLKNKTYNYNNSGYWYKSLIFEISNTTWSYNSIAIIPPSNSSYYVSPYQYNLYYQTYSNYNLEYENLLSFKR